MLENLSSNNPYSGLRILIANDEQTTVKILKTLICNKLGIPADQVMSAHNGLEALNIATDREVDVILMDLSMPVMNGFDSCMKIRSHFSQLQ